MMAAQTDSLLTIQDLVRWSACRFNEAHLCFGHGTDNAFDEAVWLVASALHMPIARVDGYRACRVTAEERANVLGLLDRRITERRPAAYLTGQTWFAGLEFFVDDTVLIPRSPLGELFSNGLAPWMDPARMGRALDLCTGSGCLGIAMAAHLPDIQVDLTDISPAALRVASRNLSLHGLDDRVRIIESDLFAGIGPPSPNDSAIAASAGDQGYDIIVSNPPYVGTEEMEALPAEYRHEPRLALAAGETGLDLVLRILRDAPDYLEDEGMLVVEVGNTAALLQRRFADVPFTWLEFDQGGDGVFLLSREQLVQYHPNFSEAVADL
ncbi:MAG: 50S ribosomal protein L3 N(5)-glutamine methyltransferase [Thiohalocapsa sp.]